MLLATGVAGWLALSSFAAPVESNLTRTFAVSSGGRLLLEADRGDIEVTTGDKTDVAVEVLRKVPGLSENAAQKVLAAHRVTFDQDGDRIEVRAKFTNEMRWPANKDRNKLQVHYRIAVPKRFNLELATAGGDIRVGSLEGELMTRTAGGDLRLAAIIGPVNGQTAGGDIALTSATGEVKLKTAGGDISLGELGGETSADTSGGDIEITRANARLSVKTSGGDIRLGHLAATTKAETSGGDIRVSVAEAPLDLGTAGGDISVNDARDTVTAHTSAGDVSVTFSGAPQADCHLGTSGGDIRVQLSPGFGFELDARTSGGEVDCRVPITVTSSTKRKDLLQGKINQGGKALVLKTSSGDVSISRK